MIKFVSGMSYLMAPARRAYLALLLFVVGLASLPPMAAHAASGVRVSTWTYNAAGLLETETIQPGDASVELITTYTYDGFGNKTKAMVSSGATGDAAITTRDSETIYDSNGRFVVTLENALNHQEQRTHDARFGAMASQQGPNNLTTYWSYDGFGRKILETRPDGTKTKWEYLWCSGVNGGTASCPTISAPSAPSTTARYVVVTTPLAADGTTAIGATEKIYFDILEREIRRESQGYHNSSQQARAIYQDTVYNDRGQSWKKTRPYFSGDTAVWTTYTYDAAGRPIREDRPNGTVTVTYEGLVNTVKNEWNELRITTKDSQGQVIHVKNGRHDGSTAIFAVSTYTYDPFGNLMSVKDDEADSSTVGTTTTFEYDIRGRKTKMVDPDKGTWLYTYDALGQLKKQRDAKLQVTEMTYDLIGRMTTRVMRSSATGPIEQTDTWTFDDAAVSMSKGKLTKAEASTPGAGIHYTRTHSFDAVGRPYDTDVTIDGGTARRFRNTYDSNSRPSVLYYPSGLTLSYEYTALGELKRVLDTASLSEYWVLTGRNASRQLTGETLGNGVTTARTYDSGRGLVTGIQTVKSGSTLQNWTIGYDSVGNVLSRDESATGVTDVLKYDPLNRLISSQTVGPSSLNYTVTMTYDAAGNLTHKSDVGDYSYPARNSARPHAVTATTSSSHGNRTFSYDANGNMDSGNGRSYVWNTFDQPISITAGSVSVSFKYGPEHHRIRQTPSNSDGTEYFTDTASGARSERMVGASNAHVRWIDYVAAGGGVALTISTTETTYNYASSAVTRTWLHRDHLGSTTLTTDAAGAVDKRMAYDAWGKRRNTNGTADSGISLETSGIPNRGFTDHEHLEQFGLIHMNGRIYDPLIARFVSADPLIDDPHSVQAFNRYSYVGNNPLTYTDPTGYLKLGRIFRMALAIAAAIVIMQPQWGLAIAMGLSTTQGAILAGVVAGAISTGSLQGAVMGGLSAGLFAGIGQLAVSPLVKVALSGTVGGMMSVMQGGKFGHGFIAAGITAAFAPGLEKIGNIAVRTAAAAMVGGLAAVASGGKFENGAMTGAFQALFSGLAETGERQGVGNKEPPNIRDNVIVDGGLGLTSNGQTLSGEIVVGCGKSISAVDCGSIIARMNNVNGVEGGFEISVNFRAATIGERPILTVSFKALEPGIAGLYDPDIFLGNRYNRQIYLDPAQQGLTPHTIAHEAGHVLGLGHQANQTNSLMSYSSGKQLGLNGTEMGRLVRAYNR